MLKTEQHSISQRHSGYAICALQTRFGSILADQTVFQIRQAFIPLSALSRGEEYKLFDTQIKVINGFNYSAGGYNGRDFNPKLCKNPDTAVKNTVKELSVNNVFPEQALLQFHGKTLPEYKLLHSLSAQQIVNTGYRNFKSFFGLMDLYNAGSLEHKPNLPGYNHKYYGHQTVPLANQQIKRHGKFILLNFKSLTEAEILSILSTLHEGEKLIEKMQESYDLKCLEHGVLRIKSDIPVEDIREVRIVPNSDYKAHSFHIDIVYEDTMADIEKLLQDDRGTNGGREFLKALVAEWDKISIDKQYKALITRAQKKAKKDTEKLKKADPTFKGKVEPEVVDKSKIKPKPLNLADIDLETFEKLFEAANKPEFKAAGMDLGLNTLVAVTYSDYSSPLICKANTETCKLLAFNQWFNKVIAQKKSALKKKFDRVLSNSISNLYEYRDNRIKDTFHKIAKLIVKEIEDRQVDVVVIGHNIGQKDEINIGKRNNQAFLNIPHAKLRQYIMYKAQAKGIIVLTHEESFTSKSSFLSNDILPKYEPSKKGGKGKKKAKAVEGEVIATTEANAEMSLATDVSASSMPPITDTAPTSLPSTTEPLTAEELAKLEEAEAVKYNFSGTRHRGRYRDRKVGKSIHSDLNGGYNIIRKLFQTIGISLDPINFEKKAFNRAFQPRVLQVYPDVPGPNAKPNPRKKKGEVEAQASSDSGLQLPEGLGQGRSGKTSDSCKNNGDVVKAVNSSGKCKKATKSKLVKDTEFANANS